MIDFFYTVHLEVSRSSFLFSAFPTFVVGLAASWATPGQWGNPASRRALGRASREMLPNLDRYVTLIRIINSACCVVLVL